MENQKEYKVGDVLFIGVNKTKKIVPVKIMERHIKETLNGNIVNYMVLTPKSAVSDEERKLIDLENIEGQIFTNLEETKNIMISKAKEASENFFKESVKEIETMVSNAEQIAVEIFARKMNEPVEN